MYAIKLTLSILLLSSTFAGITLDPKSENDSIEHLNPQPLEKLDAQVLKLLENSDHCPFFNRFGTTRREDLFSDAYGKLSPLWAQEQIGSDLANEYLDQLDEIQLPPQKTRVGILDECFDPRHLRSENVSKEIQDCQKNPDLCKATYSNPEHGSSIASLIIGPAPIGTSSKATLTRIACIYPKDNSNSQTQVQFDEILAHQIIRARKAFSEGTDQPQLINMSLSNFSIGIVGETAKKEIPQISRKAIVVLSAGNAYPLMMSQATQSLNVIKVGGISPNGALSHYSQEDSTVTVSAPSFSKIQTISHKNLEKNVDRSFQIEYSDFGGTSAATALTTGAIANALSLVPGLNSKQAKTLLRKTAIQTTGYRQDLGFNGAGSLNAYKLVRVAERLKRLSAKNRETYLNNPELYDFEKERLADEHIARELLAKTAPSDPSHMSCLQQELILKLLRKSFFLNPNSGFARGALGAIYRINGYESQAQYFESQPLESVLEEMSQRLSKTSTTFTRQKIAQEIFFIATRAGISPTRLPNLAFTTLLSMDPFPSDSDLDSPNLIETIEFAAPVTGVKPLIVFLRKILNQKQIEEELADPLRNKSLSIRSLSRFSRLLKDDDERMALIRFIFSETKSTRLLEYAFWLSENFKRSGPLHEEVIRLALQSKYPSVRVQGATLLILSESLEFCQNEAKSALSTETDSGVQKKLRSALERCKAK